MAKKARKVSGGNGVVSRHNHTAFFYGWYIVGVGILIHIASAFALSSTLSVFLRPITQELGISRGAFSLVRTAEIVVSALLSPLIGPRIDRHGGRWIVTAGALMAGMGFLLLSYMQSFWHFILIRCGLVIAGDTLMSSLVINVTISQWFVRKRGRAIAIANLGTGVAKVCIPLVTAWLFVLVGWRGAWTLFGIVTPVLVIAPALAIMRRRPEDMGLHPDGVSPSAGAEILVARSASHPPTQQAPEAEVCWSRSEILRLPTFWLLVVTFGIASIGIAGLNLHVFSFAMDIGYSPLVAATFMSAIALTQLGSTLIWGILAERLDVRKVSCGQFLIQAVGLVLSLSAAHLPLVYTGFCLYGIGLGGSFVLREIVWANFFGRLSLGTVRGTSLFFSHLFAASGAPFFGFLFDATGSYYVSFSIFAAALFTSSVLILLARPPKKSMQAKP